MHEHEPQEPEPIDATSAPTNGDGHAIVEGPQTDRLTEPLSAETQSPRLPFAVVGVGASAGGLEAYAEFLKACAPGAGIAYVLIQHLSPKHTSIMADLLQQHTTMPVHQVEDGMLVEPDHVYMIRPGHTMTLHDGRLHLGAAASLPMNRRPIDDFFKSLAEEQRERAVAVVLSGTGSNGTLGCESIKTVGGFVIAQDPETAKFPSMPRSVIDANLADTILLTGEMFEAIRRYAGHPYAKGGEQTPEAMASRERQALTEVVTVLRMRTRHDFSVYKKPTLIRRIQRRMSLMQITTMAEYSRALRQTPGEVAALSDDLMIHVTGFFRDTGVWGALQTRVIMPMVREKPDGAEIRCWVTACSSGEEAYTLGMLLLEGAEEVGKRFDVKIFATDTAERSLVHARAGVFPGGIEGEVAPDRLARFFEKEEAHYRVKKDLREMVVFAPQNVLQDPPFSRLDICTCRNLLIYIEGETQRRILSMLHFGLREGGTLVLGNSETINGAEDLFEPIDKPNRIYRRVGPTRHGLLEFPRPVALSPRAQSQLAGEGAGDDEPRALPRATVAQLAVKSLLDEHTPAAVVIDRTAQIVYYHGATHEFLMHPTGEPTRDLLTLARDEVRGGLRTALTRAVQEGQRVRHRDGTIGEGEQRQRIEIGVMPLGHETPPQYLLVSFRRYADPSPANEPHGGLQMADDLRRARDELQSTIEELQTSNEEMKASHEEITSVNEELQSANEELETSKEELQSLNEELTTVNAQLQSKMGELERTTSDLSSLLSSTEIAVVFLDRTFRIRRYTPPARELFELIPGDTGRPLQDLACKFDDPALMEDAQRVLDKLVPVEHELVAHNGRAYARRVLPYRTGDNRIDGVVLTFLDITDRQSAEASLRENETRFRAVAEVVPEMLWQVGPTGIPVWHNSRWTDYTGQSVPEARNGGWFHAIHPDDSERTRAAFDEAIRTGEAWRREHRLRNAATGEYRWFLAQGVPQRDATGRITSWFGSLTDVHDTRLVLEDLSQSAGQLKSVLEGALDFAIVLQDPGGTITQWNAGATALLGWTEAEALGRKSAMIFTPEDRAARAPEQEMEIALRDGRAPDERWHLRKDGTRFWGSGVQSVVRDEAGGVRGFVKILRDTTEQKVADESLHAAKEAAELASRAKDDFLATLSHELRTPLTAILIWARLLRTQPPGSTQSAEGVTAIERSAEAQKQLIDDLLDSARITSGQLRLDIGPVDLAALVGQAVHSVRPTAEAKGVDLQLNMAPGADVVLADPSRMRQVAWNLLANAVKFTPEGGRIDVTLSRDAGESTLRVADTGRGIAPEFLARIFERFHQEDVGATRRSGGLGLGLSIVRQLVEMHNGTIVAESAGVGRGATFTVRLPTPRGSRGRGEPAAPAPSPAAAPRVGPDELDRPLVGFRVLLVEDEPHTRRAARQLLEQAGASVDEADSAAAAMARYREQRPDVLVSDIGMPEEDGIALLARIRALESAGPAGAETPAVAVTAFAQARDLARVRDAGFVAVIVKPFQSRELIAAIRAAVIE